MIGLLQRVDEAHVTVGGERVGAIGRGLLVFIGIERGDSEATATRLLDRLLDYRVFADADGRMNCALRDSDGGLLLVPQFTLAADTRKGLRPSFHPPRHRTTANACSLSSSPPHGPRTPRSRRGASART